MLFPREFVLNGYFIVKFYLNMQKNLGFWKKVKFNIYNHLELLIIMPTGHLSQNCFQAPGSKSYELLPELDLSSPPPEEHIQKVNKKKHKKVNHKKRRVTFHNLLFIITHRGEV